MSKDLLLPPEELSTLFGSFVKPIVQLIFKLDKQKANLRRTRDLLLPRLVSGEVSVDRFEIAGE